MKKETTKIDYNSISLQSFELSPGWKISYHGFYDIEPDPGIEVVNSPYSLEIWDLFFLQDMLQLKNGEFLIDVGWHPEGNPKGSYILKMLADRSGKGEFDWENPIEVFQTKSKSELVEKVKNLSSLY